MAEHLHQGRQAEQRAREFLNAQGVHILAQNFSTPLGEIDLIGEIDGCTLFVEVRYRRQSGFGGAAASITRGKQQRLIRAAEAYLQQHPQLARRPSRFDVIAYDGADAEPQWIQDAFRL